MLTLYIRPSELPDYSVIPKNWYNFTRFCFVLLRYKHFYVPAALKVLIIACLFQEHIVLRYINLRTTIIYDFRLLPRCK